jgi:hypothetical protein
MLSVSEKICGLVNFLFTKKKMYLPTIKLFLFNTILRTQRSFHKQLI